MSAYKIEAGTAQHIGNRPQQNDRVALMTGARAPGFVLAVLADGSAGGAAAEQVLHTARQVFDEFRPGDHPSVDRIGQVLQDIVQETHLVIKMNAVAAKAGIQAGTPDGAQTRPHASFVGLILSPHGEAVWAHVGDSRLYRFRNSQCVDRTGDAAYVDHLTASGLPLESARNHRKSKLLVNTLGNDRKDPFVTVAHHAPVAAGDVFLLCSDGLWHFFTDAELAAVTAKSSPREAAELLIGKAGERSQGKGGNCSMAIVKLARPAQDGRPGPAGTQQMV